MLSRIDDIIFPNRCEVLEFSNPQRFVYPIFKNGSTSLLDYATNNSGKLLLNQQLQKLSSIDVILRDPTERMISGMQTYIYNTKQENPHLDLTTIKWFAENYLFLNRHYAPQLSWLINLNRYTKARLKFYSMDEVTAISGQKIERLKTDDKIDITVDYEMFIRLDNLLMELIGRELTFKEVLAYLESKDKIAFQKLKCIALD